MKKENEGVTETNLQTDETLQTAKKKKLVISIRDLTPEEAAHVSGGAPALTGGGSTYMCCW
jgi:hypothetical protein